MTYLKLFICFLLLLALSSCSTIKPQPAAPRDAVIGTVWGQDTLGIGQKNFQVQKFIAANPHAGVVTTLDKTFSDSIDAFAAAVKAIHPRYAEVKLINGSCHSDHNCGSYEYAAKLDMTGLCSLAGKKDAGLKIYLQGRVKVYEDIKAESPQTNFIYSPINEHGCSIAQFRILADWILEVAPSAQLANSPLGGIAIEDYRGSWRERHGNKNIGDAIILSTDGVDITQINVAALIAGAKKAKIFEAWGSPLNCRPKAWEDPRIRTACGIQKYYELMAHIWDSVPALSTHPVFSGKQCEQKSKFAAPDIWKAAGEYEGPTDKRSLLPVLITKYFLPGQPVNVLAADGTLLGYLGYFSTYLKLGWRWYMGAIGSGLSGWDLESAAVAATGSPFVWLQQGKKCKGPFVPEQRQGSYD